MEDWEELEALDRSKLREPVGVTGLVGWLEFGDEASLEPGKSLVRFFLRNPNVGI